MSQVIDLSQIKSTKKITVTGSAEMEVEADRIYLSIEMREFYNKDRKKVDLELIKKQFLDACKQAGIADSDVRVQGMGGFNANQIWERKKRKDPDFFASISYVVKVSDTKMMDKLILNLHEEATVSLYVSRVENSKEEELRKTLKQQATVNAKTKAQYMCDAIGEKMGGALLIEEISNDVMYPQMGRAMMMKSNMAMDGGGGDDTNSAEFQKIKIRFEVRAEFEIK